MNYLARCASLLVGLACFSCGNAGGSGADASQSVDASTDAPAPAADAQSEAGDAAAFPVLCDCTEADYVDRTAGEQSQRTVVPMGSTGYDPRCLVIRAGQSVVFQMDFTMHPLTSGVPHGSSVGATTPTPITAQTTGTSSTVVFSNAGFYPFYCGRHGHVGMAGAVHVVP